jgi:REP element-mobilizing transposase RayT
MKQRHSYHRLYFHLVFSTKDRAHTIFIPDDEEEIAGYLRKKAHELDAYIEELGSWYDHVHLLFRCGTTLPLAKIYRQLKGFGSRAWNLKHPDRRLRWSDGVFIASVDPDENDVLRNYIRNQRRKHSVEDLVPKWEKGWNDEL